MQMIKAVLLASVVVSGVGALRLTKCEANDFGARAFLQSTLASMGPVCEDMCKRTGAYPNCQCAGFNGEAAAVGEAAVDVDGRDCMERNCQDPNNKCPNDGFVNCVKADTKVSVLQWSALLAGVSHAFSFDGSGHASPVVNSTSFLSIGEASCTAHDYAVRAFLQAQLAAKGPVCEDMCKRTGAYPNCQCAGFNGEAAAVGAAAVDVDGRSCMDRNCQDPNNKCPNDGFVNCVKADTKVSVLQFPALIDAMEGMYLQLVHGVTNKPNGAGQPEFTKAAACAECKRHEPYLADCTCMVQDVNRAFANDATKELTTAKGYGHETVNTGEEQLAKAFMWHCRPITETQYGDMC